MLLKGIIFAREKFVEFKIIRKYDEFVEISSLWNQLLDRIESNKVFYMHEWADCFINHYITDYKDNLCIELVYDKGKLIGIFPFVLIGNGIRFITSESTDYNLYYIDKSYNKYVVANKSIEYLCKTVDIDKFALTNMPSSSELYILQDVLRKNGYVAFLEESVMAPRIDLRNGDEKFQTKQIKDIERRERRICREGNVEFKTTDKLSKKEYDFLIENRNKKYKDSIFKKPNVINFYERLAEKIKSNMYINTLYIDGEIVAMHLGFQDKDTIYYYIPVYDERFSNDAVGMILLKHLIDVNGKEKTFDFLKGNEDYKFYWCDDIRMNFHVFAYKQNKKTKLAVNLLKIKNNKIVRRIFGR